MTLAPSRDEDTNGVRSIVENARLVVRTMRDSFGVELAYDADSVKWLDGYIEENRESLDGATIEGLVSVLGSFLGEAIIRCHGGEWELREGSLCVSFAREHGEHGEGRGQGLAAAHPFAKVAKQFENGSGDSTYAFFTAIPLLMNIAGDESADGP